MKPRKPFQRPLYFGSGNKPQLPCVGTCDATARCAVCVEREKKRLREKRRRERNGNRERINAKARERYRTDAQFRADKAAREKAAWTSPRTRERKLELSRRLYGITDAHIFNDVLAMQGGVCAVCQGASANKKIVADHDHATGLLRGALCNYCNTALGLFGDDPARLERAAEYIRNSPADAFRAKQEKAS